MGAESIGVPLETLIGRPLAALAQGSITDAEYVEVPNTLDHVASTGRLTTAVVASFHAKPTVYKATPFFYAAMRATYRCG
jgi:hypothetical protein